MKNHFRKPEFPGILNAFNRVYSRQTVRNSLRAYRKFTIIRWGTKVQSITSLPELNTEFTSTIGNFHATEYWIRIHNHHQMQVKQQLAWSYDNTVTMNSPTALSFTSCWKRNWLRQSQTDKDTHTHTCARACISLRNIWHSHINRCRWRNIRILFLTGANRLRRIHCPFLLHYRVQISTSTDDINPLATEFYI